MSRRNPPNPVQHCLIAFFAVWLMFCSLGSGFLHESIGCSHDASPETVEHQEDDTAHWAAFVSDVFSTADCPVCITTKSFGVKIPEISSRVVEAPSRPLFAPCYFIVIEKPVSLRLGRAPPPGLV